MYADHVPQINAAMREDPEIFARGVMFASLSIRQPVENVPAYLDDLDRTGADSSYLLGMKRATYRHVMAHRQGLWADVCAVGLDRPQDAIARLLEVPGLGIVKSAFIAQFLGHDVACLDSRNVAREGRALRAWRTDGLPPARLARKVDAYCAETWGKAEFYWDAWCADVASARPRHTAQEISALHLAILPDSYVPF